ncbi:MAG: glutathione S-transferase N-terminal domain-containing protein [Kofleriaceae bacterium]
MFIVSSTAASVVRFPLGLRVGATGPRPVLRLELYDIEACPYCRKVREALTMLDLDVLIRPTPHGGTRFRPTAIARGGKRQFPLLVDPNTGSLLYESDAIVAHLYRHYGNGQPPLGLRLGTLGTATSGMASVLRLGTGRNVRPARAPEQPLELWSFELSPYSRRVREELCELELTYVLHNVGRDSPRRPELLARTGKIQVPYLEDPNTGAKLFESRDILRYLRTTYGR